MRRKRHEICILCGDTPCSCEKPVKKSRPRIQESRPVLVGHEETVALSAGDEHRPASLGAVASMKVSAKGEKLDIVTCSALRTLMRAGLITEDELARVDASYSRPDERRLQAQRDWWRARSRALANGPS